MEIRLNPVKDRDLNALYERVREVAEAHGLTKDEAVREALYLWLERLGQAKPTRILDVTETEGRALFAVLEAIRQAKA
jgi:hypothetical protein